MAGCKAATASSPTLPSHSTLCLPMASGGPCEALGTMSGHDFGRVESVGHCSCRLGNRDLYSKGMLLRGAWGDQHSPTPQRFATGISEPINLSSPPTIDLTQLSGDEDAEELDAFRTTPTSGSNPATSSDTSHPMTTGSASWAPAMREAAAGLRRVQDDERLAGGRRQDNWCHRRPRDGMNKTALGHVDGGRPCPYPPSRAGRGPAALRVGNLWPRVVLLRRLPDQALAPGSRILQP
ncbi:hypothetical protein B0T11DRAFT_27836 [Plectosphaerella cucumerina]|uniref:Uncharacterized protein n=1 Tax=Plectosphaerella cucumerina TaxID=40658 RepID=A0A8K0TUN2_9PEZI|nr:hypothetical protein B0T11DRAFT_27836 [Plectosphaerella cucumerina]